MTQKAGAAFNFNIFNKELLKSKPNKFVLYSSWTELVNELPSILQMTAVDENTPGLFAIPNKSKIYTNCSDKSI